MKVLLKILKMIIVMSLLFLFHFFIVFFLPKPINTINIFFIFFILFIIGWEKSVIVWLAWLVFYVFELYAVTPLGFIIVPGVLSVIVVYLLYINVFTNRSWFTGAALSAIAILINRLAYLALVYTLNYSSGISKIVLRNFFTDLFWEITLTSAATGLLFFLLSKKINRFGRDKVQMIF